MATKTLIFGFMVLAISQVMAQRESPFPSIVACNYTTQPGPSCNSCHQALLCLPNNIGIVTNCRGILHHCNRGRCNPRPSPECGPTTTPSAETTATAEESNETSTQSNETSTESNETSTQSNETSTEINETTTTVAASE